jgi:peroxiredoxin
MAFAPVARRCLAIALVTALSGAVALAANVGLPRDRALAASEPLRLPATLRTIDGETLDLAALARTKTVIVVTLKATWCPVCQHQLERIRRRLSEFEPCGVTFLVLAPGPASELAEIQSRLDLAFPFVEDTGLKISRSLGLEIGEGQIAPAILMLESDLTVGWLQRGRSGRYFGDSALGEQVACWKGIET